MSVDKLMNDRMPTKDIIKGVREYALEMTQQELATALKVTVTTISNWETGRRRPRIRSLRALRRLVRRHTTKKVR